MARLAACRRIMCRLFKGLGSRNGPCGYMEMVRVGRIFLEWEGERAVCAWRGVVGFLFIGGIIIA